MSDNLDLVVELAEKFGFPDQLWVVAYTVVAMKLMLKEDAWKLSTCLQTLTKP